MQSTRDYYEQSLLQELKKNQDLQDYIRQLEGRRAQKHANTAHTTRTDRTAHQQVLILSAELHQCVCVCD